MSVASSKPAWPAPSRALEPSRIRARVIEEHPDVLRRPAGRFDDASNPRAILVLGVFAVRDGDASTAAAMVQRALRAPTIGGLSEAWAVTEWARRFRDELARGREHASHFLDHTRDLELGELGTLG
jgi:hypothetical protein